MSPSVGDWVMWLLGQVAMGVCGDIGDSAALFPDG